MIVGNGAQNFAAAFREDYELDCPLLVDPELRAYRAAGLRRGRVELLSPRLPRNALRALRAGFRQTDVQAAQGQVYRGDEHLEPIAHHQAHAGKLADECSARAVDVPPVVAELVEPQ